MLTGQRISTNHTGISLLGDVDKWGPELRIYFPATNVNLDLGAGVDIRAGQTPNIFRINNNALWTRLIGMGFRLGTNHDLDKIKATIPPEKLAKFEPGRNIKAS